MRDGGDIERLGAGFGLSRTASYVRHAEGLKVIAEQAPNLVEVLEQAVRDGLPFGDPGRHPRADRPSGGEEDLGGRSPS
jgi:hypothetical protein